MPVRSSEAIWNGNLKEGEGKIKLGSGAFEGNYSFDSRFKEGRGTNPEELIGAAHAGCFSMALTSNLADGGYYPERIHTTADVKIEKRDNGFEITEIKLKTEAKIPDIENEVFIDQAQKAKINCPVSKALAGTKIDLEAKLI